MPLTIASASLDWALNHAIKQSDTDIFPRAFEFDAISGHWAQIKKVLQDTDLSDWTVRAARRCLAPKHKFGFRISTQLDPIDFLVYTALIYEIGGKLEKTRVPTTENIVHSYRFSPNADGRMFAEQFTYRTFQKTSQNICEQRRPRYVAIADIADFFVELVDSRAECQQGAHHVLPGACPLAAPIVSTDIASPSRRGRAEPLRDARAELWRDKRAKSRLMFVSDCNGDLPPKFPLLLFLAGRQA